MYSILLAVVIAAFDTNMSLEESKETGMNKLSLQEKVALETWIEKHYSKKFTAQNSKRGPILEENLKNGHLIRLSDHSLWEIDPSDTPITQGWITPVEIKVAQTNDSTYPYKLTNTLTGSSVKARKPNAIPKQ